MIFLKLGGSFITDKARPETARVDLISQAAKEIQQARQQAPEMHLLLGHGSGSFGHVAAEKHATHLGASTAADWKGFCEVWASANRLHRIVMDHLLEVDLPVISFPPSAYTISQTGQILDLAVEPMLRAIEAGLIPVVHGDVGFDVTQGSTILSTETVLAALLPHFHPSRMLLAGLEAGVLKTDPDGQHLLTEVSQKDLTDLQFPSSTLSDVTGGMASKVALALEMKRAYPEMEILIFSGIPAGNISHALLGGRPGTCIVT